MSTLKKMVRRFVSDEQGLETVEYAIMAGLIVVATVATVLIIGQKINAKFEELSDKLD